MIIVLIEGIVLCFALLLVCVVNIQNGPIGGVHYYEDNVKKRVVELGLITSEKIKYNRMLSGCAFMFALMIIAPLMVFKVNGVNTFKEGFIQLIIMYLECGIFDRIFIDWYWVGHTKAWIIPGTEDLMPYINKKTWTKKIILTLTLYPLLAALLSLICASL